MLWLSTIRSHDQYNTTLYSMSDRYRGVFGQRDVRVPQRMRDGEARASRTATASTSITESTDGVERIVRNFRVVGYSFPTAAARAYYPETNPLVPLYARDPLSFTPSSKAVPFVSFLPPRRKRQLLRDRPMTRPALAGRGKARCACHNTFSRSATGAGQAAERRVA